MQVGAARNWARALGGLRGSPAGRVGGWVPSLHAKYVFSVFVTGPDTERIYVFIRICRPLQRPNTLQQRMRHPEANHVT